MSTSTLRSEIAARTPSEAFDRHADRAWAVVDLCAGVAWMWGSWALLVFVDVPVVVRIGAAVSMGLSLAHAMLVGHNFNHGAILGRRADRLAAWLTSGVIASNRNYRGRHNVRHHVHRDADSLADDLSSGMFRFSPHHRWHRFHRWQHLYLIPAQTMYLVVLFISDVVAIFNGRDRDFTGDRPAPSQAVLRLPTKLLQPLVLVGVPLTMHSPPAVLAGGCLAVGVGGVAFSFVSMYGHLADVNRVPRATDVADSDARTRRIIEVAADAMTDRRWLTWFAGYAHHHHLAHHLFPQVSPYRLRLITPAIVAVCREHGLERAEHTSVTSAVRSSMRMMKMLGAEPASTLVSTATPAGGRPIAHSAGATR